MKLTPYLLKKMFTFRAKEISGYLKCTSYIESETNKNYIVSTAEKYSFI